VSEKAPEDVPEGKYSKELLAYAASLGIDAESGELDGPEGLAWLVQEAFSAPLPIGWTEQCDDEGRIYFSNEWTGQSTWLHPSDVVFREIVSLLKRFRADKPEASAEERLAAMQEYLDMAQQRCQDALEGWSGPYFEFLEDEKVAYFHNSELDVSSWCDPVADLQRDLALRYRILLRCFFLEHVEAQEHLDRPSQAASKQRWRPQPLEMTPKKHDAPQSPPPSAKSAQSFHSTRSRWTPCSTKHRAGPFCLSPLGDQKQTLLTPSRKGSLFRTPEARCSTPLSPAAKTASLQDLETSIRGFAADALESPVSLELPKTLTTSERKRVRDLVRKLDSSHLRCESFGFGEERRLYVFREPRKSSIAALQDASLEEFTFGPSEPLQIRPDVPAGQCADNL